MKSCNPIFKINAVFSASAIIFIFHHRLYQNFYFILNTETRKREPVKDDDTCP